MDEKYHWNLTDIFATAEKFEVAKRDLEKALEDVKKYEGILDQRKENVLLCYEAYERALGLYEKLYAYGMLTYHLDMANTDGTKLFKEVEALGTHFGLTTAFLVPEMTRLNEAQLKGLIEDSCLQKYKRLLQEVLEEKKHVLTQKEEELLAQYNEVWSASENTFDVLTNTEFKFGKIRDENGEELEMTEATYTKFLKSPNQAVRKQAFELMYGQYSKFLGTITELYLMCVKQDTIISKIRKYQSSLEKAVLKDDASMKVYEALIESVRRNLPANHRFMALKKKLLQLDEMHLYDVYRNPIEVQEDKITFEQAKQEVLEGLAILGEEYTKQLQEAFENHWIDVYEKPNKRGGAYSLGVYGVHPFVLTNFVESKRDVSTIAHELGHSMHSYYSNQTQPILDSNYTIMVAEVASTVNELLLASYQIEKETDRLKKAELLYELLEMIRSTLFRQVMFAEFEKMVHEKIEQKEMLSSEDLCKIYYDLNQTYFGDSVVIDKQIQYEWLRIPHFYSCFYVYKYATGICSAIAIARKILKKEPGFVEKYLDMLKQGCSKKSIELLKMVDVDLESSNAYEEAITFYEEKRKELEDLISN